MEIELVGSVEIAKIQAIFEPLDYTFLVIEKREGEADAAVHVTYQVRWKHSGVGGAALELLTAVEERYKVLSFERVTTAA